MSKLTATEAREVASLLRAHHPHEKPGSLNTAILAEYMDQLGWCLDRLDNYEAEHRFARRAAMQVAIDAVGYKVSKLLEGGMTVRESKIMTILRDAFDAARDGDVVR